MASAARVKRAATKLPVSPLPRINLSQIQERAKCGYRWDLRYRRGIDRRSFHGPMDLGSVVHAGMAGAIRYFGHQEVRTKAIFRRTDAALVEACVMKVAEMVDKLGGPEYLTTDEKMVRDEIEEAGISIARRSVGFLRLERWETYWYKGEPLVEQMVEFECDGYIYHFTPDWVAEDLEEGGVWVLDYKVRKQFHPPDAEEVNVQFPAYQYGLGQIGLLTTGSIMIQTKAKAPSLPKLNQNGSMSRAKIATDWETYKVALVECGLDPADYEADMKSKLTTEFFREERTYRNQFTVNAFWENLVEPAAKQLIADEVKPLRHMNHMNCQGCWARRFCLAELMEEDTDYLLSTEYVDLNSPAPRQILRPEDFLGVEE